MTTMNQRTLLISLAATIILLVAFRSCKRVEVKQTSDAEKTIFSVEIRKEKPTES